MLFNDLFDILIPTSWGNYSNNVVFLKLIDMPRNLLWVKLLMGDVDSNFEKVVVYNSLLCKLRVFGIGNS